ncbi:MAG: hypothetical protein M1831_003166 [Alyxoria varia]|nr:MAG: hypothetical protein M1831_003166 [Alyxoria varia]
MDITTFIISNREKAFLIGSHSAYRSQLTRQLLKLRRRLGRSTPKNQKTPRNDPVTAEDVGKDKRFIHLQLLTAERAWAHAMAMKDAHAEGEGTEVKGSTRSHIISRLYKAARCASDLAVLLQNNKKTCGINAIDVLDASAYSSYLSGISEFEKQFPRHFDSANDQKSAWKPCLAHFSEAHIVYTALLHHTKRQEFKEFLAGSIDPSIRYAAYSSGYPRTIPISTVAKQHFRRDDTERVNALTRLYPESLESDEKLKAKGIASDIPTTITWRNRTAPIADAAIGQAMAATSTAASNLANTFSASSSSSTGSVNSAASLTKTLSASYDPVLTSAADTVDAVRGALTDLSKEGVPESDRRTQDLRITDLAANYGLISWRVGRNRVVTSSAPRAAATNRTLDDGLNFDPLAPSTPSTRHTRKGKNGKPAPDTSDQKQPRAEPPRHQLTRLSTRLALYDATLQSIQQISTFSGAAKDTAFQSELSAQKSYFTALRTLNIAYSYNIVGKAREALALFDKAAGYVRDLKPDAAVAGTSVSGMGHAGEGSDDNVPTLSVSSTQMRALQAHLSDKVTRQRALVTLQDHIPPLSSLAADASNVKASKPEHGVIPAANKKPDQDNQQRQPSLVETNLSTFPARGAADVNLTNLVPYPPRMEPVPVQPIFLDLAWNHLEYPGRAKAQAQRGDESDGGGVGTEAQARSRGWFGFGRG